MSKLLGIIKSHFHITIYSLSRMCSLVCSVCEIVILYPIHSILLSTRLVSSLTLYYTYPASLNFSLSCHHLFSPTLISTSSLLYPRLTSSLLYPHLFSALPSPQLTSLHLTSSLLDACLLSVLFFISPCTHSPLLFFFFSSPFFFLSSPLFYVSSRLFPLLPTPLSSPGCSVWCGSQWR